MLHSSLYAAALLACLVLIPLARSSLARANRATWLTVFLALQSSGFLFEWLMLHPSSPAKALWLGLLMTLAFLLAPCLWLCARELTSESPPKLGALPPAHSIVVAAGILLVLPLVASTHAGTDFAPDQPQPPSWHGALIHEGMLAAIALFGLQAAFYLRECIRILVRHTRESKALFSNIDDQSLNTLRALILILAMHWVVGMARGLYGFLLGREAGPSLVFALCEVAVVAWAVFTLPKSRPAVDAKERQLVDENPEKYSRSALDHAARTRIRRKLDEAFETRGLHRDGRLSLRSLCADLRENAHYVSQVINQDLKLSFFDLVNRHRVREAMTLLTRHPDKPVLEIALAVGFNSKSTFNAAFRQHAGLTPSAFRAENTSQPSGSDA